MASATQPPPTQSRWPGRNQSSNNSAQYVNERRPLSKDGQQFPNSQPLSPLSNEITTNLPPTPQQMQHQERTHSRTHSFLSSFRKNTVANQPSGSNTRPPVDEFGANTSPKSRLIESPPSQRQNSPPQQQSKSIMNS